MTPLEAATTRNATAAAVPAEALLRDRVRELRTQRGWSQTDLCERLARLGWPVDQTTVSNLELGRRAIRVAEADTIAMAFGLTLSALLDPGAEARERDLRERIAGEILAVVLHPNQDGDR